MDNSSMERLLVEVATQMRQRFYGKYRGKVVNVDDPEKLGRIRALVPEVLGDVESPWALPCTAYNGKDVGMSMIPPKDAVVWFEFEAGDPSRPIWTGGWWAKNEVPKDETGKSADPKLKVIRSEEGLMIAFDDAKKAIAVSDSGGNNLLKIKVDDGELRIQSKTKIVIESPQIQLVENSTHALVFGDELLKYLTQLCTMFKTHTHPGETVLGIPVSPAPPVPPFPDPQPSMLSTKVTTG